MNYKIWDYLTWKSSSLHICVRFTLQQFILLILRSYRLKQMSWNHCWQKGHFSQSSSSVPLTYFFKHKTQQLFIIVKQSYSFSDWSKPGLWSDTYSSEIGNSKKSSVVAPFSSCLLDNLWICTVLEMDYE